MLERTIVRIGCSLPKGTKDVLCGECGLPLQHHEVWFEVLDYCDYYDVYSLYPVQFEGFNPSASSRILVLHVSGKAFAKFREVQP